MKQELHRLIKQFEERADKAIHFPKDLWAYISGEEKLSKEALDRIALFLGFQTWEDFLKELKGE